MELADVEIEVEDGDVMVSVGAVASVGAFGTELNVRIPLMALNLLGSIALLSNTCRVFAEKCIDGIQANRAGTDASAGATLAVATALNGAIGYDKGTEIVKTGDRLGPPTARGRTRSGRGREAVRLGRGPAPDRPRQSGLTHPRAASRPHAFAGSNIGGKSGLECESFHTRCTPPPA